MNEINPPCLKQGDAALVVFQPTKPICVEVYSDFPPLGSFVIRDMNKTIAVGVVKAVKKEKVE